MWAKVKFDPNSSWESEKQQIEEWQKFYATIGYEQLQEDLESGVFDETNSNVSKSQRDLAKRNRLLVEASQKQPEVLTLIETKAMYSAANDPEERLQKMHRVTNPSEMDPRNPASPYYDHPAARPPI